MCLAILEQLRTISLATVVTSLPPRTGTMMHIPVTALSSIKVVGGMHIAIIHAHLNGLYYQSSRSDCSGVLWGSWPPGYCITIKFDEMKLQ